MRPLQRWLAKYKVSREVSIREWTATGSKRLGLSSSSQVVALNSRPEGGSQAGTVMFKGDHNNRCLTGRLGCCLGRQSSTRQMGGLVDRRTHKPLGAGGSISGLDTFSSSVSGEAGGCSFRQHNSRVINHQGGVRSISLHRKARDLLLWAHAQGVSLRAVHLPGEDNVAVDLLSRGGPRPGKW